MLWIFPVNELTVGGSGKRGWFWREREKRETTLILYLNWMQSVSTCFVRPSSQYRPQLISVTYVKMSDYEGYVFVYLYTMHLVMGHSMTNVCIRILGNILADKFFTAICYILLTGLTIHKYIITPLPSCFIYLVYAVAVGRRGHRGWAGRLLPVSAGASLSPRWRFTWPPFPRGFPEQRCRWFNEPKGVVRLRKVNDASPNCHRKAFLFVCVTDVSQGWMSQDKFTQNYLNVFTIQRKFKSTMRSSGTLLHSLYYT